MHVVFFTACGDVNGLEINERDYSNLWREREREREREEGSNLAVLSTLRCYKSMRVFDLRMR